MATLFILAARLAAHTFLGTIINNAEEACEPRRRPAVCEVIHPKGPRGARRFASGLQKGSEKQFRDLFRISREAFQALVRWLKINEGLRGTRYQTAEQKLMVVLYILGRGRDQRVAAHKFGITQSSISRTIATILPMLMSLHIAFVRLPEDDWLDPAVELNPKMSAFNGCIGAIDGTHIRAHIKASEQIRWFNRKGREEEDDSGNSGDSGWLEWGCKCKESYDFKPFFHS
ncbi:hypothetical protein B0H67DRAFT_613179 [Lasiosphaeris hirsuta]|uniref:DUF8040 domain-containing protein n=1 Tax=Lasiosphaeris hirsuta TaxID=260670 RepID=A0AA39ZW11_9PEZI|nr:hypothetical protein B0H67DRAFT_613179 [Lasiosphaeris hirsuta]